MDPVVPEDEYFEWEDIMADQTIRADRDENIILESEALASCTWNLESVEVCRVPDVKSKGTIMAPSKPPHSLRATLTLDTSSLGINSVESTPTKNPPIVFPSYTEFSEVGTSLLIENFTAKVAHFEFAHETMDDISLSPNASRHVDYLSHDWNEEDIWATWKRLQSKRQAPDVAERLENATWRAWAKVRLKLKTVSPESFNWMKDLDDTWLYGPFHGKISHTTELTTDHSNVKTLSHPALTVKKTRSILKRPRLSEVLLRGSEHLERLRSKSVELGSCPFYGDTPKKRVLFREEVEQYAAVPDSHLDEGNKELDYWTEIYQSKYAYDSEFSDPVEDLLSTTESLRHHLEQNIKILENYRAPPCPAPRADERPAVPLKAPRHTPELASSGGSGRKATSSPTRPRNEPLRFSTLSEWTLLGEGFDGFDEDDDWLEPKRAPFTNWKPKAPIDEDITSYRRTNQSLPIQKPNTKLGVAATTQSLHQDEMAALMRCEELYLDPPSSSFSESSTSDTSSSTSNRSEEIERDELSHVRVRDLEEAGREVMEMKQAFVDRVIDEFYRSDKEDGVQNFGLLVPPELIESAMTVC